MKELSIEEKARAYDKAIAHTKKLLKTIGNATLGNLVLKNEFKNMFPALEESEDERIRKALLKSFNYTNPWDFLNARGIAKCSIVAWLEKQGEQMSDPRYSILDKLIEADDIYQMSVNDAMVEEAKNKAIEALSKLEISKLLGLEKQGNLMKALQISNAEIGELVEKNYYLKEQLEKQGNNMGISEATKQKLEDNLNKALEKETQESWNEFLDKQCEQKPDKVEPKFKVGDWLIFNEHHNSVYQVEKIQDLRYYLRHYTGGSLSVHFDNQLIRHWTIQDAKDGDVVVDKSDGAIGIFQSIGHYPDGGSCNDPSYCFLHCRYDDGYFYADFENGNTMDSDDVIPATKEQHNQLEKAMADAGYEWDAKNKQLRKVEPRQEELTEFEKAVKQVMEEAIECGDTNNLKADADMLLRLVQKSSWSKEDERIYKSITYSLAHNYPLTVQQQEFVKSLKERYTWRPSYEQVSVLEFVMGDIEKDSIRYRVLNSVLEDLKKLREK